MNRRLTLAAALLLAVGFLLPAGCAASYERRDPTGERFPQVSGGALDGTPVDLPEVGAGAPLLLLVGYEQEAQFDIDRWLLGLVQAGMEVRVLEVPTIPGMVPGMFSGSIDAGMRRGIPEEDWGLVVTVYGDADAVAQFTGNEDGLTGRVLLLDAAGEVVFFHDRGYSVGALQRLGESLAILAGSGEEMR